MKKTCRIVQPLNNEQIEDVPTIGTCYIKSSSLSETSPWEDSEEEAN
jgi:hypothetical protein